MNLTNTYRHAFILALLEHAAGGESGTVCLPLNFMRGKIHAAFAASTLAHFHRLLHENMVPQSVFHSWVKRLSSEVRYLNPAIPA